MGWLTTSMIHKLYTNYIHIYVILFWEVFPPPAFLKVLVSTLPLFLRKISTWKSWKLDSLVRPLYLRRALKQNWGEEGWTVVFYVFYSNTHIQWYRYLIRVLQRIISHMVSNDIKGFIYSKWYNSCFHQQYFSLSWLSSAFSGKMKL